MMALQLRSLVRKGGELEVSLVDVEVPQPQPDEVVIASRRRRSIRPISA